MSATAPPRLSPEQRTKLYKEDETWIGKPFDVGANPRAIQANTRHMALTLLDTKIEHRASRAAAFAEQLIDTLMTDRVTGPVACGKGCSHCCNTFVSATIPEIFNLARSVRNTPVTTTRVHVAAARAKQIPQLLREANRIACPILLDHICSEYLGRPISCRYLLSKSLDSCVKIFQHNQPEEFPFSDNTVTIRSFAVIMMKAALILSGLPHQHYELTQALSVALADEQAEERWLAGQPVFADIPMDRVDQEAKSPVSGLVDYFVGLLRPTI